MTMPISEVSRNEWVAFFEALTSEHAGQPVSLGVDGRHSEHELVDMEARELPLWAIAADLKDRENTVVISLGPSSDELLRHSIQAVSHVRIAQTEDGSYSALTIESMYGQTTTLDFSEPVSSKSESDT